MDPYKALAFLFLFHMSYGPNSLTSLVNVGFSSLSDELSLFLGSNFSSNFPRLQCVINFNYLCEKRNVSNILMSFYDKLDYA